MILANQNKDSVEVMVQLAEVETIKWPALSSLAMDPAKARWRRGGIGGSDANVIYSGDRVRLHALWCEKRGVQEPADLTSNLAVMLGTWTECFNRQWYERITGEQVSDVGLMAVSQTHCWRRASLDGFVESRSSVWEAKHTNAFAKPEEVLARYMPQLQHNMAVLGVEHATLSVIYGNHRWECYEIAADWMYQEDLLFAEECFWESVKSGVEPTLPVPAVAPRVDRLREINFAGNNAWAAAAADWLENLEAAKRHSASVTALKDLIEADVGCAYGHGIEAKRSKAGAITIKASAR